MRIVEINSMDDGSTGKIILQIANIARIENNNIWCCYPRNRDNSKLKDNTILIGGMFGKRLHARLSEFTGFNGCFSYFSTKKLIRQLIYIQPDVIHLHNLHGWYINLPLLFKYIKHTNRKVIWTLHDCWAFTGHCPHFTMEKCDKWQTGCFKCPRYRDYPQSFFDNSKKMWKLKKKWFTGVKNLTIVTPSEWLAGLVKQSFLKEYPVKVIHNGIDLNIFKPTESNFRERYNIGKKFIVLGVAFGWGVRKGLDVFIELSKRLDNEKYQIVLVGTDGTVDKQLPKNIVSIHRTQNQTELAEIYTAADVFANPTREENYPTVNMESIACGTPVVTFRTGGSPEILTEKTGSVVDYNDVNAMNSEIIRICETKPYSEKDCLEVAKNFDMKDKFKEYVELYKEIYEV